MKSIYQNIFLGLALLMAWSCTDALDPVIKSDPSAPVLMTPSSGTSLTLTSEQEMEEVSFEFEEVDYGFSAAVTYTVQMDLVGNGFAEPLNVVMTSKSPAKINYGDFNQKLLTKGLSPGEASEVEFRVRSRVSPDVDDEFSETITMNLTPYKVALEFPKLYIPGDYQGWNPANENTVIYDDNGDQVYEGFVHILGGSGAFKVNEEPNWDINYGDDGADGTLDANGDDIVAEGVGTFELTVDLANKTFSIADPLYWGIIGDATAGGWDSSTPLEFDPEENVLTLTTDLTAGLMKFRANDAWDNNYGDDDGDGVLEAGGADISVDEAGSYTITMDFKTPGEVTYTLEKN
ncbi:SusE domain-containing protein [Echinicola jeungdonensis]|uniref:SusE domain-containing protein n=1 Tax=Echinicola jeungdonensis TaxID=709343 RepID=A0ABV5J5A9_9BACT|nr:SusE domain-containing protein [Echinicola jeungdonensis]MDN3667904.1 SusE domain-containing protein [Echinicola jeungdonensis]